MQSALQIYKIIQIYFKESLTNKWLLNNQYVCQASSIGIGMMTDLQAEVIGEGFAMTICSLALFLYYCYVFVISSYYTQYKL